MSWLLRVKECHGKAKNEQIVSDVVATVKILRQLDYKPQDAWRSPDELSVLWSLQPARSHVTTTYML